MWTEPHAPTPHLGLLPSSPPLQGEGRGGVGLGSMQGRTGPEGGEKLAHHGGGSGGARPTQWQLGTGGAGLEPTGGKKGVVEEWA